MRGSPASLAINAVLIGTVLVWGGCIGNGARAQGAGGDYSVREQNGQEPPSEQARPEQESPVGGNAAEGPVRLARISYLQGDVTWRPDDSAEWSPGTVNLPLRQGAQIWVSNGGRAEIQFDDGSLLRLGNNGVATLQTLYSDSEGEFTEIKLTDGLAALRLKHERSVFQVDTPLVSVKSTGPSALRVGVGDGVEVGVRSGSAMVEGTQGKADLQRGDYLDLATGDSRYEVRSLPQEDSWEQWNDQRDDRLTSADNDNRVHRLPPNIALVAGDLDDYGDWQDVPQYGWVWCPRTSAAQWRPYQYGHWTWVNPFGWTWVSEEPWGWAPYHYGTWTRLSRGWAWVPGPVTQCWSPAVVHFTECDHRVAWCALAPAEIRYAPVAAFGFGGRNWSAFFSIGRAGVYYPTSGGYCEPRTFNTTIVNHVTYNNTVVNINNAPGRFQRSQEYFASNHNTYLSRPFVPLNSRVASGVVVTDESGFGGSGRYEAAGQTGSMLFQRGKVVAAPISGHAPVAGPIAARPTVQALTPTRTYLSNVRLNPRVAQQPIYRAPVRPAIERTGAPVRTLPVNPGGSPVLGNRNPGIRGGSTGADGPLNRGGSPRIGERNGVGRPASGETSNPRIGTPVGGSNPRGDGTPPLTSAQIRARDARQSLSHGNSDNRADGTGRRGGDQPSTGPTGQPNSEYRRRDPNNTGGYAPRGGSGSGRDAGDDTRRRDPSPQTGRTPPVDTRSGGTSPGTGRGGSSDTPRNSEPRRYQTPQAPGNSAPRRDPAPQPPRNTEPRRDPAPQPPRNTEPRHDRAPEQPRQSRSDQGKSDQGKKDSDNKNKDSGSSGSSSPASGRGRR